MSVTTLRSNLLLGTILAAGIGCAGAALAQSTTGYGSYPSGTYGTAPAPATPYGSPTYSSPSYASPSYRSSTSSTPTYESSVSSGGMPSAVTVDSSVGQRTSADLMPTEKAPPEAISDPALWAQWQKHSQYAYDRGYEAGRRAAMSYMQSNTEGANQYQGMAAPTDAGSMPQGAAPQIYTRTSDRYDGPRADAARYDTSYGGAPVGEAEPWWSTSWDRMVSSDWPRMRDEIRRRWPQLSGYDLERVQGQRSMLLTVLQDRYRLSNERAHEQVVAWQQQLGG